jgi:hypothetical protein
VRPGITGLAQVRLPADADLGTVERKLNHDLHYIRTSGLLLDARIALATFLQLLGVAAGAMSRQLVQRHVPAIEHPLMLKPLAEDADAFDAEADLAIAA